MKIPNQQIKQLLILVNGLILIMSTATSILNTHSVSAQTPTQTPDPLIDNLLQNLTPEEKIGQLFLITFHGTDLSEKSQINEFITKYHIGGVIILAKNDNITYIAQAPNDTTIELKSLIKNLQFIEWKASQETQLEPNTEAEFTPTYIPLLIGISQEGDGYPYDQIFSGIVSLPNAMALGGAWQPPLAESIGEIVIDAISTLINEKKTTNKGIIICD